MVFRKIEHYIPLILLTILFMELYGICVGYPHRFTDWFWRPQFVETCVTMSGHLLDDKTNWWVNHCNEAYNKINTLKDRNWR